MMKKFGVFWSACGLLTTALIALGTSTAYAVDSFADWANVSAGYIHTCGVRLNGKLYCWGDDGNGRLGLGPTVGPAGVPVRVGDLQDWAMVSAGNGHTCGVRKNGKLYCWGKDDKGQVGDEDDPHGALSPRRIGALEDWVTVSAGYAHTCGIRKNGKLYCWGDDYYGQVGDGDANGADAPRRIGVHEDWANVSAGYRHSCGVRKIGKIYCWGNDSEGQIGNGSQTGNVISPQRIDTREDWASASAGGLHSCGVRKNGKLYCWGQDDQGQVGDGDQPTHSTTTPQRIGVHEDWANVSAGWLHSCGVRTIGKIYCWGLDNKNQIGNGSPTGNVISPQRIDTARQDWTTATAGGFHSCGIRVQKLYCWGFDTSGQVGDGGNPDPAKVPRRI
jgi:alpha-tubulin suppressor-like RCC1 family protein